jgi:hypothetical protein
MFSTMSRIWSKRRRQKKPEPPLLPEEEDDQKNSNENGEAGLEDWKKRVLHAACC